MRKILWLSGLLALWLGAPFCANAQPSNLILLRNVNVAAATDNTRIELRFNRTPNEKGITYQGDFVQIELPDTYVDPPKQWVNVGDDIIRNIFLYQWNDTTVRMRLFTPGKAEDLKDKLRFSQEGKKIFIQYNIPFEGEASASPGLTKDDQNTLPVDSGSGGRDRVGMGVSEGQGQTGGLKSETGGGDLLPAGAVLASPVSAIPEGLPAPEEQPPAPQPSADIKLTQSMPADQKISLGGGAPNLYASLLKMVAALGILIALLFAALYIVKRVFGKKMGIAGQDQSIRVITSAYLGPKKSIALVDIAGERIVVGITQDHISMLTKLGKGGEFREILQEQVSADEKVELQDELWEKV